MEDMLKELMERYPELGSTKSEIINARNMVINTLEKGGKVLLCGNGGSAADCDHISGELLKGFLNKRPLTQDDLNRFSTIEGGYDLACKLQYGLPAIPLPAFNSLISAYSNDVDASAVYAQLVMALGTPGDLLVCITTSGNSVNIINAAMTAKNRGLSTIGMTGSHGGKLLSLVDCCIRVPEEETYKVQELHLPVYHYICAAVEAHFFPQERTD